VQWATKDSLVGSGCIGSQLADLIPESFRPISIDDLADALGDVPTPSVLPSEMPARELIMVARIEAMRS